MRHHGETSQSTLKGMWMIAGCIAVMLLAFVLLSGSEYANLGFLVLLLCPVMHLFMHRHGHRGKTDPKKEAPLTTASQNEDNDPPQGDRGCH